MDKQSLYNATATASEARQTILGYNFCFTTKCVQLSTSTLFGRMSLNVFSKLLIAKQMGIQNGGVPFM